MKELIEKNQILLTNINSLVKAMHRQDFDRGLRLAGSISKRMEELMDGLAVYRDVLRQEGIEVQGEYILSMLTSLLEAQKNRDYILMADLYELQLSPFLGRLQESLIVIIGSIPVYDLDKYNQNFAVIARRFPAAAAALRRARAPQRLFGKNHAVEYTSSGALTLAVRKKDGGRCYFHSNNNPYSEAEDIARHIYRAERSHYIVYGIGFAYHINAILSLDESVEIEIFESDIEVLQMALAFAELDKILERENVKLHYDVSLMDLYRTAAEDTDAVLFIHYPSLQNIGDAAAREGLENYYLQLQAGRNQLPLLQSNFRENQKLDCPGIEELAEQFKNKRVFIIAAGPSLDKNMLELNKRKAGDILLATGTVLRKLLGAGITPDYVIVSEPAGRAVYQSRGVETRGIPLLFVSTASSAYVKMHKGKRYIACQSGYSEAELLAERNGWRTIHTGGSVATAAFGIGLALQCSTIVFVGLDLAYTGERRHAEDLPGAALLEDDTLRVTADINGQQVTTGRNLEIFRKWFEQMISNNQQLCCIDATEGGAYIEGTELMTLAEVMGQAE